MIIATKGQKDELRQALTNLGCSKEDHYSRLVMIPPHPKYDSLPSNIFVDVDCFYCKGTGSIKKRYKNKNNITYCNCIRTIDKSFPVSWIKVPKNLKADHKKRGK